MESVCNLILHLLHSDIYLLTALTVMQYNTSINLSPLPLTYFICLHRLMFMMVCVMTVWLCCTVPKYIYMLVCMCQGKQFTLSDTMQSMLLIYGLSNRSVTLCLWHPQTHLPTCIQIIGCLPWRADNSIYRYILVKP